MGCRTLKSHEMFNRQECMKKLEVGMQYSLGHNFINVLEANTVIERGFPALPPCPAAFSSANLSFVLAPAFFRLRDELAQRE